MNTTYEPPFFNLLEKSEYYGNQPVFYDTSKFDWLPAVEANWIEIRTEILNAINSGESFKTFNSGTSPGLSRPFSWKKVYLMNMLWIQPSNCRKFPKIWETFLKIPGVVMGAILILEPNSSILPHCSESNINIRFHLGIDIPAPYPVCGIRVRNEERGWENGKTFAFSDCHIHTVWNNSDRDRIIIAFDVLKPEYEKHKSWYCAKYLSALSVRAVIGKLKLLGVLPRWLHLLLFNVCAIIWLFFIPAQRILLPKLYK